MNYSVVSRKKMVPRNSDLAWTSWVVTITISKNYVRKYMTYFQKKKIDDLFSFDLYTKQLRSQELKFIIQAADQKRQVMK